MFEAESQIKQFIILSTLTALIFTVIIVIFVVFYRRKRAFHLKEKQLLSTTFDKELLQAKMEIRDTTLQHFTSEIHDNIGQKLSIARIYINRLEAAKAASGEKNELEAISQLMGEAINDLRTIANTLGHAVEVGLVKSLQNEAERINQLNIVACHVAVSGDAQEALSSQQELLLFRICQEFIQNSIRHAGCTAICIRLYFNDNLFTMQLKDNGKGFNYATALERSTGSGLKNIRNRTKMLGGEMNIISENGTELTLTLPIHIKENG